MKLYILNRIVNTSDNNELNGSYILGAFDSFEKAKEYATKRMRARKDLIFEEVFYDFWQADITESKYEIFRIKEFELNKVDEEEL